MSKRIRFHLDENVDPAIALGLRRYGIDATITTELSINDMTITRTQEMGIVTTTITVSNLVDEILAERGFIKSEQIRSITLNNVLVDTGATRLCLPADIISDLGLPLAGEIDVKTAAGIRKTRLFKRVSLTVAGRQGEFTCTELPGGEDPLLGLIPLEELGLNPDVINQKLIVLPETGKDTYHLIL